MSKISTQSNVDVFKSRLLSHKTNIDSDIETFSKQLTSQTAEQFGEYSGEAMAVFCDVLSRGGKRIRGALTMLAYDMFGGKDASVAIEAARIMELVQTYLLVVDDVYDQSKTRRGKSTAHVMFAELHRTSHWKSDPAHFGESIAVNTGLVGMHIAMTLLADLNVDAELVVRATKLLNTNLQVTGEGQANDVFNEVAEVTDKSKIDNVLVWKTAYYTFVNPLQFGATLAGASAKEVDTLCEFSIAAGRVFQISDDILGTFGSEFESGKSPMDDIREGKRTLLILYALKHASKEDIYFLERMLGNHDITAHEFKKCKDILFASGALDYAKAEAAQSAEDAVALAHKNWGHKYPKHTEFLVGLVQYLLTRKS